VPAARRRALLIVALLVGLALVVAFWWWAEVSQPTLRWDPGAYHVSSDSSVDVTFSVTKDPSATVICRIIAQDASGAVIGTKDVEVGTGSGTSQHTVTLVTRGKAVVGTVDTCQATG
jgi:uncharacterized protein (DUF58 family)